MSVNASKIMCDVADVHILTMCLTRDAFVITSEGLAHAQRGLHQLVWACDAHSTSWELIDAVSRFVCFSYSWHAADISTEAYEPTDCILRKR